MIKRNTDAEALAVYAQRIMNLERALRECRDALQSHVDAGNGGEYALSQANAALGLAKP